jgi:hypothetical protein
MNGKEDMEVNLKNQLEKFNKTTFSDIEFIKILNHLHNEFITIPSVKYTINYLYEFPGFIDFIKQNQLDYIFLLLYDLNIIGKLINLPKEHIIIFTGTRLKIINEKDKLNEFNKIIKKNKQINKPDKTNGDNNIINIDNTCDIIDDNNNDNINDDTQQVIEFNLTKVNSWADDE